MIARRRHTNTGSSKDDNTSVLVGQHRQGLSLRASADLGSSAEAFDLIMSCRERTGEFQAAIKSLQSRRALAVAPYKQQNGVSHQPSEFTLLSRKIGSDISNTFSKLEKLAILAKSKSLFDDKPVEIQELTYIIKQDINNLNQQIGYLQELANARKSGKSKHVQTHSHTVVMSLQSKLAHMSKDFKSVLEVRTENMKHQKSRRDQFSQGPLVDSLQSAAMAGPSRGSVLQMHEGPQGASALEGSVALDMEPFHQGAYSSQTQLLEEQDEYVKSRATAMESIEQTIVELGGIFTQLAHMVKEQEEQIQRIDANVEDTEMNVDAAHGEILKYFQSITSNRWLIIKIFFVLIIFFIIFVVFMA